MKLSELIARLQDQLLAFGDLPVDVAYGRKDGLVASEDVWCVGLIYRGKKVIGSCVFLQSANNADDASEESAERTMQEKEDIRRMRGEIRRCLVECLKGFPANRKETEQ